MKMLKNLTSLRVRKYLQKITKLHKQQIKYIRLRTVLQNKYYFPKTLL